MNHRLSARVVFCLAAVGLLAGAAPAADYEFLYRSGPTSMIIPENEFRSFHAELVNIGDMADSYTITIERDQPDTWTFYICYDDQCFVDNDPVSTHTLPLEGTLAPGATAEITFDVTSLFTAGTGVYTVTITSNNDPSQTGTWVYDVAPPADEDHAMLFAGGHGVIGTTVNSFVGFEPVLYNAGAQEDSYTLTMTRDLPPNWTATFCYDGFCYQPDETTMRVPEDEGTFIPSGGAMPILIDFTTLLDEGTGTVVVSLVSNSDPTISSVASFTVTTGSIVAVDDTPAALVSNLRAVPNPFNPRTEIRFVLGGERTRDALIDIVDIAGNHVRTLRAADLTPGRQSVSWDGLAQDGRAAAAGVYLARIRVGGTAQSVKMTLVK